MKPIKKTDMKKTLLLHFFLILFAFVNAQWSENPMVNNVICNLGGEQAIPKIAIGPSGDSYIGYFSNEGGNYNVRLQRIDQLGNILWAANGLLISNNNSDTWLTDWDMTVDQTNHAVMVWQDIRNGNNNVYAYRIAPDGSFVWGANGLALSNNSAFNASPKVTITNANNAVFAWQSDNVVIMQKVNPTGSLQWGSNGITLSSANRYTWPQLLPSGTDDIILKLFDDSGPVNAPTRHVLARRFAANGSPVWSSYTTVSNAGGISAWTQVFSFITDGNDGFYIAWHDDRDMNMRSSVFVQHVNHAGQTQFSANGVEASTASSQNHSYPFLAKLPGSSDVFVYWMEQNSNQSQWGITGQKLNSSGAKQWTNTGMVFIPVTNTQVYPIDARTSPTDMVVFYEEYSNVLLSTVKAMRIATDGSFVWNPATAFVSALQSEKGKAVATAFHNNQWVLAWEDNRNGNRDIYAQNIQLDASLGPHNSQFGIIEGTVTLNGGNGNVMQTIVTAGNYTTNPNNSGVYSLEVAIGTYTVSASLTGYYPESISNVVVFNETTTGGIDFILDAIPTHGFIEGTVSLIGGDGDVTQVLVSAAGITTFPAANGFYTLEVPVGTWDVEASLPGYYTTVEAGVVVLPGLTTNGVDISLFPLPASGFIEGVVELLGGSGNLTDVIVSNGNQSAHPDQTGYYIIECEPGIYDVSASLGGYQTQVIEDVQVAEDQTTTDIDFTLAPNPQNGYITGHITISGGSADVTLTAIKAGPYMTYAEEDGNYLLETIPGVFNVLAFNPYTMSQTINGVEVLSENTTTDINFDLLVVRTDIVCRAFDSDNNLLNEVSVTLQGSDTLLSGNIVNDSLVFYHVPFGSYIGNAGYAQHDVEQTFLIDATHNQVAFLFHMVGIATQEPASDKMLSPNPISGGQKLFIPATENELISIDIFHAGGQRMYSLHHQKSINGNIIINFDDTRLPPGIYLLKITESNKQKIIKLIVQ
jgi:hypothetical protein